MIIIGEKINATIPKVRVIIRERDKEALLELTKRQATAGADYIDINVGTGVGSQEDEIRSMQWAVQTIQREVDTALCIDSADPAVLEAALDARNGRPTLINSTKAEKSSLEKVVPLTKSYNAPLVALSMDETGVPSSAEDRIRACKNIARVCEKYGVLLESVFFDPLVLPISTDVNQGLVTLYTLMKVKETFPMAKTIVGLSNISYGLPARARLNAAFLQMAIFTGLDATIMDPLDKELMDAVKTAYVLLGKDRHCRGYIRAFRGG